MNALSPGITSNVSIASRVLRCYRTSGEQTRNAALANIDRHQYLRDLNPAQLSAVEYGIGGDRRSPRALLIAAGAGTGKTQTLVHRVAHLILDGADPHRSAAEPARQQGTDAVDGGDDRPALLGAVSGAGVPHGLLWL